MWRATFINQTLDEVSHLLFKQNRHDKTVSLFSLQLLNARVKCLNI